MNKKTNMNRNRLFYDEDDEIEIKEELENIVFICKNDEDFIDKFTKRHGVRKITGDNIHWTFEKTNSKIISFFNKFYEIDLEKEYTLIPKKEIAITSANKQVIWQNDAENLYLVDYTEKSYVLKCSKDWAKEENRFGYSGTNMEVMKNLKFKFGTSWTESNGLTFPGWMVAKSNDEAVEFLEKLSGLDLKISKKKKTRVESGPSLTEVKIITPMDEFLNVVKSLEDEYHVVMEKKVEKGKVCVLGKLREVDERMIEKYPDNNIITELTNGVNKIVLFEL